MSPPHSPRLLVSVRSAEEAVAALNAGADIIDVKEPSRGPLGAADPDTIAAVIAAVARRCPVSAALGELIDHPSPRDLPRGLSYAKIGLLGAGRFDWRDRLAAHFAAIPDAAAIAVGYVDRWPASAPPTPRLDEVLNWAIDHKAAGILLDTYQKAGDDLPRISNCGHLFDFIAKARAAGLIIALAGSITAANLGEVLSYGSDVVALRGAACVNGDRKQPIDPQRVRALAELIAKRAGRTPRSPRVPANGRAG